MERTAYADVHISMAFWDHDKDAAIEVGKEGAYRTFATLVPVEKINRADIRFGSLLTDYTNTGLPLVSDGAYIARYFLTVSETPRRNYTVAPRGGDPAIYSPYRDNE